MEYNKYYTPTIEEFHVGFEYELLGNSGNWYKNNFGDANGEYWNELSECYWDITHNKLRVKYLDQSDIESLGWELEQYVPERNICLNFKKPNDWYLNYWFGQIPYIEIFRDGYDTGCALNVKNKSELIKLMQQLNIK